MTIMMPTLINSFPQEQHCRGFDWHLRPKVTGACGIDAAFFVLWLSTNDGHLLHTTTTEYTYM